MALIDEPTVTPVYKNKYVTTKKPTGLAITRSGMKFTLEWKIGDANYAGDHRLYYTTNYSAKEKDSAIKWTAVSIGAKTTKKTVTISTSGFFPNTTTQLQNVAFKVWGRRQNYKEIKGNTTTTYKMQPSDAVIKVFSLTTPDKPALTATLDNTYTNVSTFEWSLNNNIASHKDVTSFEWQTVLVKECMEGNLDSPSIKFNSTAAGWATGTSSASSGSTGSSKTITEDSALLAANSYTRWFRVRSRGASGPSKWRYARHVYARPFTAIISKTGSVQTATTITVTATWTAKKDNAHPIDLTTVQYLIDTPAASLAPPSGASWSDGEVIKDTSGKDAAKFSVENTVGEDEVLWIRVATQHDQEIVYSQPTVVRCGYLADLDDNDLSVSLNQSTRVVTIGIVNNSAVPDSKVAVIYRHAGRKNQIIGIIDHGDTSDSFKCPQWSDINKVSFCVYAFQGDYIGRTDYGTGLSSYQIDANMTSNKLYYAASQLPTEPTNITCKQSETKDEVILTWKNTWSDATGLEISWSQNKNAWESNNGPQRYSVDNIETPRWRISDLDLGVRWYFRLRFFKDELFGPYSDLVSIVLSSAPQMPVLSLSAAAVARDESFTASWVYVTTDTTEQAHAEVRAATISGSTVTIGSKLASTQGEQSVLLNPKSLGWSAGSTHSICVRVTSESGVESAWSRPVSINVAEAISCTISQTSLSDVSVVRDYNPSVSASVTSGSFDDLVINADKFGEQFDYTAGSYTFSVTDSVWSYEPSGSDPEEIDPNDYGLFSEATSGVIVLTLSTNPETATEKALTVMPLTATITGAGTGGTTTLIIERAENYAMERPDGEPIDGYEGETVAIVRQMGEAQITVRNLIGVLDDGASYRLIAIVEDGYGQTDSKSMDFSVRWAHQAVMPEGSVARNDLVTVIRPVQPTGYASGDVCDIYRLSADKPELIVKDGTFGEVYVDPYPAIGEGVGHRIVFRTKNGDYITADNHPAWLDLVDDAVIDEYSIIVDFGKRQAILPYNINLSNRWAKDFKMTAYLGGAQQGDWNPGVTRTATYTTVLMDDEDSEAIKALRDLADYHGICHIRTPEGSSYSANVEVSENTAYNSGGKRSYTLTTTRVDPENLDGMTYEEWSNQR